MYIKGVFPPGKSASSLALVRTKYSAVVFCLFGAVRYHTALFASESETVNETTHVLMVIHLLVYPFNRTRVYLGAYWDHLFGFCPPESDRCIHTCPKDPHKGGKQTSLIQSRQMWILPLISHILYFRFSNHLCFNEESWVTISVR